MRASGGALFAAGSLSWAAAQWIMVWMFARYGGGADAVGIYAMLLSVTTPIFTVASFGLRTVYLSLPTQFPWRSYLTLRVVGSLSAVVVLSVYFAVSLAQESLLWGALLLLKVADLLFDLQQARLQRRSRLAILGILNLVNSIGTIALAALALMLFGSISYALLGSAFASLLVVVVAERIAAKQADMNVTLEAGYGRLIRAGFPTMLSEGFASLSSYLPILVLSRIADESRLGLFTAASYLLTFANLAGAIIKNIVIGSFRQILESEGKAKLLRVVHSRVGLLVVIAVVCSPIIVLFGDPVLRWIYGDEFGMSMLDLGILAFALIPVAPAYVYSAMLNVMELFTSQAWIWGLAIAFGLVGGLSAVEFGAESLTVAFIVAICASWARFAGVVLLVLRSSLRA